MTVLPLVPVTDPDTQFNFDRIAIALSGTAGLPAAILAQAANVRVFAARLACTATPSVTSGIGVTGIARTVAGQYVITHSTCNGPSGLMFAVVTAYSSSVAGAIAAADPLTATTTRINVFNTAGTRIDGESISLVGIG